MGTISLTFGDQAENHVGMQMIGKKAKEGFTYSEIRKLYQKYRDDYKCKFIKLHSNLPSKKRKNNRAAVLIIHEGLKIFDVSSKKLWKEQRKLKFDKKALMRGRVVNKIARYNLCYGDKRQKPKYKKGKGRVINFKTVPLMNKVRKGMKEVFGRKAKNLVAELNYYYDVSKCGIGFHGDTERRIVICIRLGETIPLHFQWFHQSKRVGKTIKLKVRDGDIYIMSEKATGNDWKKRSLYTIRHAAGAKKYLTLK